MAKANEEQIFETQEVKLLAGYTDEAGVTHTDAEIREMLGVDEEMVQKSENRSNIGRLVTSLLVGCVTKIGPYVSKDMKPAQWEKIVKSLYLGDRDLLLMEIRKLTYGGEVELPFQCQNPECKQKGKHILDWEEIEIEELEVSPHNIPFELKRGVRDKEGQLVKHGTLRLPTGEDQELLDSIARKNMGQANTSLITRCVKDLGTVKLSAKTFKDMSVADREKLVVLIGESHFGPNFKIEIDCPSCGSTFDVGVNPVNFL